MVWDRSILTADTSRNDPIQLSITPLLIVCLNELGVFPSASACLIMTIVEQVTVEVC